MANETLKEARDLQRSLNDELKIAEITGEKIKRHRKFMLNDAIATLESDIKRGKIRDDELNVLKKITDANSTTKDLAKELLDVEHKITKEGKKQHLLDQKRNLERGIADKKAKARMDEMKSGFGEIDNLFGGFVGQFKNFVKSPMAAFVGLAGAGVALFGKYQTRLQGIGDNFGSLGLQSEDLRESTQSISANAAGMGRSFADSVNVSDMLRKNMGLSVKESLELSEQILETSRTLGVSDDTSVGLFNSFKNIVGLSKTEAVLQSKITAQLAKQMNVAPKEVLQDIAENSEIFASASKESINNLAAAAIQARKLGTNIKSVRDSQDSILDLESSIQAETAANMALGLNLNLNRARQLSFAEDDLGYQQEIVKQLKEQDLSVLKNRFGYRMLAKSIGFNVEETKKMVLAIRDGKDPITDLNEEVDTASKAAKDMDFKDSMTGVQQLMAETNKLAENLANTLVPAFDGIDASLKGIADTMGDIGTNKSGEWEMSQSRLLAGVAGLGMGYAGLRVGMKSGFGMKGMFGGGKGATGGMGWNEFQKANKGKGFSPAKMSKMFKSQGTKTAGKGIMKGLGKKIPGIGLLLGAGLAYDQFFNEGDITGGFLELGSGIASLVPGIGTAVSTGLDAVSIARDMKGDSAGMNATTTSAATPGGGTPGAPTVDLSTKSIEGMANSIVQEMQKGLKLEGKVVNRDQVNVMLTSTALG
tara:strand:+ start:575 stop:2689 length:2115 start_codon:yes stop_codon:yes gene_type:complete